MKNATSILATVLMFVLLVLSIGINIKQYRTNEAKNDRITSLIQTDGQNTVVDHYIRDSITHTVFKEKVIGDTRAEKQLAIGKSYADSIERALKKSLDKIDQISKINARLEAQLLLKESTDTNGRKSLAHRDKTIDLTYYPDTDSVDLGVDIGLNEARYSERKWILGNRQNFVEVFPDDKRITIKGLKSYVIKESPQRRFGIGVSSGYGAFADGPTLKMMPYVGLGINYNLIEF